jgi:hypothetical protein
MLLLLGKLYGNFTTFYYMMPVKSISGCDGAVNDKRSFKCLIGNIWMANIQRTIGVPMGAGCAALLAALFLYACEQDFLQGYLMGKDRTLTQRLTLVLASSVWMVFCQ